MLKDKYLLLKSEFFVFNTYKNKLGAAHCSAPSSANSEKSKTF